MGWSWNIFFVSIGLLFTTYRCPLLDVGFPKTAPTLTILRFPHPAVEGVAIAQDSRESRCFQFTWLGPRWNNQSVFLNATCEDATRLASGVPCRQPLVVSYDGTWPDIDYIWTHHYPQASCVLASNDVCARYIYSFDGHVENATFLCTRAVDSMGSAITSGCYEQINGSFSTRVCFCRSVPGGVPCNSATVSTHISLLAFLFGVLIFRCILN